MDQKALSESSHGERLENWIITGAADKTVRMHTARSDRERDEMSQED